MSTLRCIETGYPGTGPLFDDVGARLKAFITYNQTTNATTISNGTSSVTDIGPGQNYIYCTVPFTGNGIQAAQTGPGSLYYYVCSGNLSSTGCTVTSRATAGTLTDTVIGWGALGPWA